MTTFAEVVERADSLSNEEREELIRILEARLREERRAEIMEDVKASAAAYRSGKCKVMTPAQIIVACESEPCACFELLGN